MKAAYRFFVVLFAFSLPTLLAQAPTSNVTSPPAQSISTGASQPSTAVDTSPTSSADDDDNPAGSAVRIVRLSQVRGTAEMDRGTGNGFETAFANLPVVQGAKLQTSDGIAEVEFEDNSTLRLTPDSLVTFTTLDRNVAGSTISSIRVLKGTVYVSLEKTKGNTFTLSCDQGTATLFPGSQTRLVANDSSEPGLAVLTGSAQFQGPDGTPVEIHKKKELLLTSARPEGDDLITGIKDGTYDGWYESQEDFHRHFSKGSALSGSPYQYGVADLNYYGSFADLAGCGRVWRPYFASAAWDPYDNGIWSWYPNFGYSWVSPYPWGWAPFHYGAWEQCGGGLWGWAPGGTWSGLGNVYGPRRHDGPGRFPISHPHPGPGGGPVYHHFPVRPHPPIRGRASFVLANTKPITMSGLNQQTHAFVFRNDSAGLGVPRGTFGKLNKASTDVGQHGSMALPMMAVRMPNHVNPGDHGAGNSSEHRSFVTEWRPVVDANRHEISNGSAGNSWAGNHTSNSGNNGGWSHSGTTNTGSSSTHAGSTGGGGWSGGGHAGGGGGGGFSGGHSGGGSGGGGGGGHAGGGGGGGGHR